MKFPLGGGQLTQALLRLAGLGWKRRYWLCLFLRLCLARHR
jgi:hypothetical protein